MENAGESDALLVKEYFSDSAPYQHESCSSSVESCNNSDDWWNGSGSESVSSSSSSYSEYECSLLEWESKIGPRGELFYIESVSYRDLGNVACDSTTLDSKRNESSTSRSNRRGTKGKLARLIRRHGNKMPKEDIIASSNPSVYSMQPKDSANSRENSNNKVTFHDWQQGEVREVKVPVEGKVAHNLGRRATLAEIFLGLTTSTFADGTRVMIAGFIPNGEAAKHCGIKIGTPNQRRTDGWLVNNMSFN